VRTYVTERPVQQGGADMLAASIKIEDAPKAPVDVDDEVLTQLRFASGASAPSRQPATGGSPQFLSLKSTDAGSLVFNYERRESCKCFFADDPSDRRGFRTIYNGSGPSEWRIAVAIPGTGIGYSETKIMSATTS